MTWQPIETAPRGVGILILNGDGIMGIGVIDAADEFDVDRLAGNAAFVGGHHSRHLTVFMRSRPFADVTHWMPLPSPPNPTAQARITEGD